MVRLQKFLADAGVASRRAAERMILGGLVSVNGQMVTELGTKVDERTARVTVDGEPVRVRRKIYLAINKPRGFICSKHDPKSRNVVGDLLPAEWARTLHPVGRLDWDSEGLLFLTNDGDLTLRLTHPRYGIHKYYRATIVGKLEPEDLRPFTAGIRHEGEMLKAERVRLISSNNSHSLVELELGEGKNREVRRMFEAIGFEVERLQRTQIGKIRLGELPVGKYRVLTDAEVKSLLQDAR
jgi:23S rRNA pseudouridine2605 synthase